MKILFIGGNGNISWYCVQKAIERGHDVWELNRSQTVRTRRDIQPEVHKITGDIHKVREIKTLLEGSYFDVIIDYICFNEHDAIDAIDIFRGKTGHFVFISSEAVYKRACHNLPFSEDCIQNNPEQMGAYVGGKIRAEKIFRDAMAEDGFPLTIIRPSLTYDVIVPVSIGQNCFTAPSKFLEGKPALIAGDGTNLLSFTHSKDFASAIIPLVENMDTVGEAFHIATDEWLSWNEEMKILFDVLKIHPFSAIHIPYEEALLIDTFQSKDVVAQRMWHNIYNTSKVKEYVPGWKAKISFEEGIGETIKWLNEKRERKRISDVYSKALDNLYVKYMGRYK